MFGTIFLHLYLAVLCLQLLQSLNLLVLLVHLGLQCVEHLRHKLGVILALLPRTMTSW